MNIFPSALQASKVASSIYQKKRTKFRKEIQKLIKNAMKEGLSVISLKTDIYDKTTRDELKELGYVCNIFGKCKDCCTKYDDTHDEPDDEIDNSIFTINKCLNNNHDAYYKMIIAYSIVIGDVEKTLEEPCPICYEKIYCNVESYSTCSQCKKNIHKRCYQKIKTPKCPMCRILDVFVHNYPNTVF